MNQNYWLIKEIVTEGLTQYYESDTKINYVGDGLYKVT